MLISIIIPCYNSHLSVMRVVEMTIEELNKHTEDEFEFVLVDDYSNDDTFKVIRELCNKYSFVKGIRLTKNFGQHNALMTALNYAEGEVIVGMDDDLQTHPSQISKLLNKLNEGYDLVYGKYPEKKHGFFRNMGSRFNDFTVRKLLRKPKGLVASSFWAAKKLVRDEVIEYPNYNVHLQGLFLRTTKNICNVDVEHFEREFGSSGYTLRKLIRLWLGCINFSIVPLRFSMILGMVFSLFGFLGGVIVVINKFLSVDVQIGWTSIMSVLFLFFGVTLIVLGIIGEYVGRIFLCINREPQFIIKEKLNIE